MFLARLFMHRNFSHKRMMPHFLYLDLIQKKDPIILFLVRILLHATFYYCIYNRNSHILAILKDYHLVDQ